MLASNSSDYKLIRTQHRVSCCTLILCYVAGQAACNSQAGGAPAEHRSMLSLHKLSVCPSSFSGRLLVLLYLSCCTDLIPGLQAKLLAIHKQVAHQQRTQERLVLAINRSDYMLDEPSNTLMQAGTPLAVPRTCLASQSGPPIPRSTLLRLAVSCVVLAQQLDVEQSDSVLIARASGCLRRAQVWQTSACASWTQLAHIAVRPLRLLKACCQGLINSCCCSEAAVLSQLMCRWSSTPSRRPSAAS